MTSAHAAQTVPYGTVRLAMIAQAGSGRNAVTAEGLLDGAQRACFTKDRNVRAKSAIRKKRDAEAKPFRTKLVADVGECENCGCSPSNRRGRMPSLAELAVHEIADGPNRNKAQDKPYAVLVLCSQCNCGAFKDRAEWPEARQLALLARRRPKDFSLADYLTLTSPRAPRRIEIDEVLAFMEEDYLTKQDIAERLQVDRRSVQNWISQGDLPAIDCRTAGAGKPLYRVAWSDFLEFCKSRRVLAR